MKKKDAWMENILRRKGRKIRRGKESKQKNYVCKKGQRSGEGDEKATKQRKHPWNIEKEAR